MPITECWHFGPAIVKVGVEIQHPQYEIQSFITCIILFTDARGISLITPSFVLNILPGFNVSDVCFFTG